MASLRSTLHTIVFESSTFAGQAFDALLFVCIGASVSLTMLESVRSHRVAHAELFWDAERTFTGLFTAEYVLRVCVAHPGRAPAGIDPSTTSRPPTVRPTLAPSRHAS